MPSIRLTQGRAIGVMLAGILGILYAPFYAMAYFATEDGAGQMTGLAESWTGALRPVLEDPFLTFASPNVVYLTYGLALGVVMLGYVGALLLLHQRQAGQAGRLGRWGFRLAFVGCLSLVLGSIVCYGIGRIWWGALDIGFFAFMIPGLLLTGLGFPLFGIGLLRAKDAPTLAAVLMVVGGLPGILVLTAVLGQLSLALLPLHLSVIVLGYWLYREERSPTRSSPVIA